MGTAFRFDPVELPPACEALRGEVREFIAGELAAGLWVPNSDFGSHRSAAFSRRLGARGWIGMTWPKRYGGRGRSMLERYIVTEELLAAGAPVGSHWIADRQSAPLLLRYGTEEQRLAFLPGIARGENFFCIGMSEPDSGSDLASIRTRAVAVTGGYEVTGAKVWTSYAHESHFAITLVRTAPAEAAKIRAGEAAGKVAEIAHQVHGAIGFTHEHSLHRLTRRLWSWRDEFGTESHWSRELGRAVLASGADALWPTITAE